MLTEKASNGKRRRKRRNRRKTERGTEEEAVKGREGEGKPIVVFWQNVALIIQESYRILSMKMLKRFVDFIKVIDTSSNAIPVRAKYYRDCVFSSRGEKKSRSLLLFRIPSWIACKFENIS